MSLFDKPIDQLEYDDLQELLETGAVENIRLEFKREVPARDETLKKLSSFANTFGGHVVIGASADSETGAVEELVGVEPEQGLKQRIVNWGLAHVSPPISPFVSGPIPVPGESGRVCYVIYVPLSLSAPHFLTGRRGIYIRTDELSGRFEPRLANISEIVHLLDRRSTAVSERESIRAKSLARFDSLAASRYAEDAHTDGDIGATLHVTVIPSYPAADLTTEPELYRISGEEHVGWRGVGFPRMNRDRITQTGSVIMPKAGGTFSTLELGVRGNLHYASELERTTQHGATGIHLGSLLGESIAFLRYSAGVLARLGYQGPLVVTVRLDRAKDVPVLYASHGFMETGPASPIDDTVEFTLDTSTEVLSDPADPLAKDLLVSILFALNWADAIEKNWIDGLLGWAYEYNSWERPGATDGEGPEEEEPGAEEE